MKTIAGDFDFVCIASLGSPANLPTLTENKESGDDRFSYANWMPNPFASIMKF